MVTRQQIWIMVYGADEQSVERAGACVIPNSPSTISVKIGTVGKIFSTCSTPSAGTQTDIGSMSSFREIMRQKSIGHDGDDDIEASHLLKNHSLLVPQQFCPQHTE